MRKVLLGILILVLVIVAYFVSNIATREYKAWEIDPEYALNEAMGGSKIYTAAASIITKWTGKEPVKLENWRAFEPKETDKNQILFIFSQQLRTEAAQDKLLDWVAQGNHLVTPIEIASELKNYIDEESDDDEYEDEDSVKPSANAFGLGSRLNVVQTQDYKHLPIRVLAKNNKLKPHPLCIKESQDRENAWKAVGDPLTFSSKQYANKTLPQLREIAEEELKAAERKQRVSQNYYMINSLIRCTLRLNEGRLPEGQTMFVSTNSVGVRSKSLLYFGKGKPIFEGTSPTGSDIIKVAHGKGSVTFVSNSSLFKNPNVPTEEENTIRQFDHAWLLTYLVQGKDKIMFLPKAKDFIQKQKTNPSLLGKMIKDAPELTAAIFLLGILFIWQKAWRHGPVLAPVNLSRRRLEEHFSAQGEFVRRHSGLKTLLQQLQDDLWHRIGKRIPNITQLPIDRKTEELKRLTGLSSADLMYLLKPLPTKLSPFDLVKYVISLQKIRNKL